MSPAAEMDSLLLSLLAVVCASMAASDHALVQQTASALGLEPHDVVVSHRIDDGTTTRFRARTESGEDYHCLVGGSVSLLGRSVSPAVCTPGAPLAQTPRPAR